jgi:hypothetical protein
LKKRKKRKKLEAVRGYKTRGQQTVQSAFGIKFLLNLRNLKKGKPKATFGKEREEERRGSGLLLKECQI